MYKPGNLLQAVFIVTFNVILKGKENTRRGKKVDTFSLFFGQDFVGDGLTEARGFHMASGEILGLHDVERIIPDEITKHDVVELFNNALLWKSNVTIDSVVNVVGIILKKV